jgi:dTMP kinase
MATMGGKGSTPDLPPQGGPRPAQGGPYGALLRARGFVRLLVAQSISSLGDWVATLAFIAAAYALTGNQTAVAVVLVLRLVPPIFAAPVGGVVADRWDRRRIMVVCDLLRAGLIVLVPFVGIGLLYVLAFAHECASLFFLPARDASVPTLAPAGTLPEANGLVLASSYGTLPFAAALFGGLRLAAQHVPSFVPFADVLREHPTSFAFLFDAATFLVSAALNARLPLPRERGGGRVDLVEGVAEGVRYLLASPRLRALASGLVVSMVGGGVLFAVGIAYIRETLGGSDVDFGWLAALYGLGMAAGLGQVRVVVRFRGGEGPAFLAAVVACGAVLIVMALLPFRWLAFLAAVLFGAAFSTAVMLALSMAQAGTEERFRGRMMGGVQMLFRIGLGAGALGIGALASLVDHVTIGPVTLDGNQLGLLAGGAVILLGAAASSSVARRGA